ncbi:PAS domain S-box/diguanylate cyclase (GGDEF) domain-containing protein [Methylomicrobium album BG8]|uniref:PAS domain S-box/diguanylate cyclase (GGDEF) domain-containing protein n=1 Tax=Methylomicrobium album BG8 TaxID=686340 RepID=H8GMG1_METAL|nr:PAS domain S-box/diguanylate cyclase (GGDEF) domain-containing protein [Methylomicrobium album BG8]
MSPHSPKLSIIPVQSASFISSADPPRWTGRIQLPGNRHVVDILIFEILGEFKAFPAFCPHQGINLTHCPLVGEKMLVCPGHQLCIEALNDTHSYHVEKVEGRFVVILIEEGPVDQNAQIFGDQHSLALERMREEIEQLRMANLKQERQILVITRSMDAMLSESELQKLNFKERAEQEKAFARFVNRILDTMDDLMFFFDKKGRIRRVNTAVERELGFTEADLVTSCIDDLLPVADRQYLADRLPILPWPVHSVVMETIRLNGCYSGEHELLSKHLDNAQAVYWLKSSVLHSEQGKLEGAVITALNITELKVREMRLRLSSKVFDNCSEAIFITDPQGTIQEVNDSFCEITGYERGEVLGKNTRLLKSNMHDQAFYKQLWHSLLNHGSWRGEIWDRRKNGELCPMLASINAVYDDQDQLMHYVAVCSDISQQKQTEQQLQQLAYYDALTQLPNRALFKDRLEHEIRVAQRSHTRLAVFFLDLDHFKNVNDTLGHWVGDYLLKIVASRIQRCLRESDTISRLGGDEFTIILPGLIGIADSTELAQRLNDEVQKPIEIAEHAIHVTTSIGIAVFPDDGNDFHTLTKHADTAMYASKAKGRGQFQYFEAGMNEAAHQRLLLENALRLAIEQEDFQLHYQLKVGGSLERIAGAEALIRWKRPGFGMMPPDRFISIAEETGLIIPLGAWILRMACLQAKAWKDKIAEFRIAVNLSPRQLLDDDFVSILDRILAETGTSPEWIELEVTESLVMHDIDKACERLCQIRSRGIRIAMDDFGTGYSSLSYLQKLPLQVLKIDRSFVQAYTGDPTSSEAIFIKTIIALGHSLNMTVVAEGVENESQLAVLKAHGCDEFQGYYFSPPLSADEFERLWLDPNKHAVDFTASLNND